jgi:hypothetical protein
MKDCMVRSIVVALLCAALCACAGRQLPPAPQNTTPLPPAPPPGEPADLAGAAPEQVKLAFGEPSFVRKDGGIEMWRYDGAGCKAFFFLYPAGSALAVRHVETLPRGQVMAADAACLDALRSRAHVS